MECYNLFLKGNSLYLKWSLLKHQFNKTSTSTFQHKSIYLEQLEVRNHSNTDNLECHVTYFLKEFAMIMWCSSYMFLPRFYSMPE